MRHYDSAGNLRKQSTTGEEAKRWYERAYKAPPQIFDLGFLEPDSLQDCADRLEIAQDSLFQLENLLKFPIDMPRGNGFNNGRRLRPLEAQQRRAGLLSERAALEDEMTNLKRWAQAHLKDENTPVRRTSMAERAHRAANPAPDLRGDEYLLKLLGLVTELLDAGEKLPAGGEALIDEIRNYLDV